MCLEVLEHVDDVKETLDKISELMKPGATLILSTINRKLSDQKVLEAETIMKQLDEMNENSK